MARPIRFATADGTSRDRERLLRSARRAEDAGYSTFGVADHFMMPLAPLVALQAVADATSRIGLTQVVLAQGFRHPAVLAKELATLDVLSGGRLEIGIGAGWMQAEFDQAGIAFDRASVRIERLEEVVLVLKGLFGDGPFTYHGDHFTITGLDGIPKPVQRPHPPILIGGGGPKLLAVAARQADIVQILPLTRRGAPVTSFAPISEDAYQEQVDLVRKEAGARFDRIELSILLSHVTITDDTERALEDLASRYEWPGSGVPDLDALRRSPAVAVGSLDEVCDKLVWVRETFGFSYFQAPVDVKPVSLAPVIEGVRGR